MKNGPDQSLGDVIREFLQTYHLEEKVNQKRLIASWGKIVGKMVDTHTKRLYIRNKVLFVKLDSPALCNELNYSREKIMDALNGEINEKVIEEIVFQV